ncbi:MAG: methionine--tRNA ligase [Coriobacteriales bacterium]|nr:methionine--tRNA ligase [Coriobacteriales bacterium]
MACGCGCSEGKTPKGSYFITTPIYYVNAQPHLGTAYSTVVADVQARFRRLDGYDTFFLTGLDEHGQKVADSAAAHDMTPQEWCDSMVPAFKELWQELEISNDDFIRTTQERHERSVQHFWEVLKERGYIYKGNYEGWYCVPDETFFTETDVRHANEDYEEKGETPVCPDCRRPLVRISEQSWFFKLSEFQEPLLKMYANNPNFLEPEIRRNEVVSFIEGGLKDLSVTRTTFDWGIPLPFDTDHVTYVWFDALINYLTAVGYGDPEAADTFAYRWPAQTHIVGKDITRFHCVIWPAMLMAAGLPVPEHVLAHGFLLVKNPVTGKGEKMSKSRGNAIAPREVINLLGVEGYRYYFMVDVAHGTDGAISFDRMAQVYNTDLANRWGNLVSRTLNMCAKYFDGKTPARGCDFAQRPSVLRDRAQGIYERYATQMANFSYGDAAAVVMELVSEANNYIETAKPFSLAKDPEKAEELAFVMWSLVEAIRIAAIFLSPFIPQASAEVLRRIGENPQITCTLEEASEWGLFGGDTPVEKGEALFPRLDESMLPHTAE